MPSQTDFLYPPRPGGSIMPGDLGYYEKTGLWCVQPKFNESRILTHVLPNGQVVFWTRHAKRPAPTHFNAPALSIEVTRCLRLTQGLEYWIDGGVMNKGKGGEGELVFYDVLCVGQYLFQKQAQEDRLKMLEMICGHPQTLNPESTAMQISDHLWMSTCFRNGFNERLKTLLHVPYIEGLMLRKLSSQLDNYGTKQYEASWMKRCRVK
jgi:hypothetical protein